MSRSGYMADDLITQPVLPRKDPRILDIDVDVDIDANVANLAPGNPVWFERLLSADPPPYTGHQTLDRPAKATYEGNGAKFDETNARLAARTDQHDNSVAL